MKSKKILLYIVFLGSLLLDQLTKFLVDSKMMLGESKEIIPGFFNITYVRNTGAAWSIMEGKMYFFYAVSIIAIVVLVAFYKNLSKWDMINRVAILLMISGTIGNLIDRLAFNYVRDFLDFIIFNYDFPVFNIADCALVIGVGIIILNEFLDSLGVKKYGRK